MKLTTLLVLLSLLASCRAKKSTTYIEKVKDSTVRNIVLESRNLLEVSTLCDSLGFAKEFSQVIETGSGTAKVEVRDNKLTVDVRGDSIVYVDRLKEKVVTDTKVVTEFRVPRWAWWVMGIPWLIVVAFIAFPGVPRWIRGLVL